MEEKKRFQKFPNVIILLINHLIQFSKSKFTTFLPGKNFYAFLIPSTLQNFNSLSHGESQRASLFFILLRHPLSAGSRHSTQFFVLSDMKRLSD